MTAIHWVGLAVSVALLAYLFVALMKPEKF
ncbi:MAG TPA: K(+)-transporting ATPase subunit F [Planctomycetota bacterium]|jgi:K+-transporting ATPase KdpF subunit|nr:K(+)-transporting ATPase subunit F [Planctomycetota bacterium]